MNGVFVRLESCLTLTNNALVAFAVAPYTSYRLFHAQMMTLGRYISHPARLVVASDRR